MKKLILIAFLISLTSCSSEKEFKKKITLKDKNFEYKNYKPSGK